MSNTINSAPTINWELLPERLQSNWHIYLTVRSTALVKHALSVAGQTNFSDAWIEKYDQAANDWLEANPENPMWATGKWPSAAAVYLGSEAREQANRLLGLK